MTSGRRVLVVACGALVRELQAVLAQLPAVEVDVEYLPAHLHNRPERITDAVCPCWTARGLRLRPAGRGLRRLPDGGRLGAALAERGVARLEGARCYEFLASARVFEALQDAEPGTFYLTDYLARHFGALVMGGLGLDRHPSCGTYFGHYRRVVHLAQSDAPEVAAAAREPPSSSAWRTSSGPPAWRRSAPKWSACWRSRDPHGGLVGGARGDDRVRSSLRDDR